MSCKARSPDQTRTSATGLNAGSLSVRASVQGPRAKDQRAEAAWGRRQVTPGEAPKHVPQITEAQREELDEFFNFWILCSLRSTCTFSQLEKLKN